VMRKGRRLPQPSLEQAREHARRELAALPDNCRRLHGPEPIVPAISAGLHAMAERVDRDFP